MTGTGDWYDVWRSPTADPRTASRTGRGVFVWVIKRQMPHPCAWGKRTPLAGCDCGCNTVKG